MSKFNLCGLTLAAGSVLGQSALIPGDVEDGRRLFRANCAICHGPEGNAVPGIDFNHGKFMRTSSDDDLRNIIINGIDGTAMPPHNFTSFQAGTVVAYLRFMS